MLFPLFALACALPDDAQDPADRDPAELSDPSTSSDLCRGCSGSTSTWAETWVGVRLALDPELAAQLSTLEGAFHGSVLDEDGAELHPFEDLPALLPADGSPTEVLEEVDVGEHTEVWVAGFFDLDGDGVHENNEPMAVPYANAFSVTPDEEIEIWLQLIIF